MKGEGLVKGEGEGREVLVKEREEGEEGLVKGEGGKKGRRGRGEYKGNKGDKWDRDKGLVKGENNISETKVIRETKNCPGCSSITRLLNTPTTPL